MTVSFQLDGQPFIALNGGPHFKFNEAISFSVDCKTQSEVDEFLKNFPQVEKKANAAGSKTDMVCPGRSTRPSWARC